MNELITPSQADQIIRESIDPLPEELLYFLDATGFVLRAPLVADRPFPPYDRVMMDGIACRSQDLPGPFEIEGLHPAGAPAPRQLRAGHCWKIMTGAVLPADCDTIIPIEELEINDKSARLVTDFKPEPGQFIHRQGSDCEEGTALVSVGTRIGPAETSIAATVGATTLSTSRFPRVVILTTGDELVPPHHTPEPHQLRQSNGATLFSALIEYGLPLTSIRDFHVHDDLAQTKRALEDIVGGQAPDILDDDGEHADLVLITGGISKGERDHVRAALEDLVGEPAFHGVKQRPGKPLAYWKPSKKNPAIFALPGNPNSALTSFYRYVLTALDLLSGATLIKPVTLPLAEAFQPHPELTLHLPASLDEEGRLVLHRPQNSGDIPATLKAIGYAEIPPGEAPLERVAFRLA
ncbi:MAG: molybdopterin molybdotransferase MoeA [Verrucomicrobiota bacterium JB023]|nr:molybdopterin molybdotransferase MoeA [Verrucomicrobiota bacterium JB023]